MQSQRKVLYERDMTQNHVQKNHINDLVLEPLEITAPPPISLRKCTGRIITYALSWERRQVATPIHSHGLQGKNFFHGSSVE